MRRSFVESIIEIARIDDRVFLIVGDVGYSLMEPFIEEFPHRFINAGIAEQNMIGVAAGMSACDKIVFVYSLANFPTLRCLEQIRNDVCYHNLNVKIISSGAGLTYGPLGATHHATEDIAIMRTLPNMVVIAPGDPIESSLATKAAYEWDGPCYLRLVGTGDPVIHEVIPDFHIGKAIRLCEGDDICIIATGSMINTAMQAAKKVLKIGIRSRVISMHTLKPLDKISIISAAKDIGKILTIEEHSEIGGLGSAVSEVLLNEGLQNTQLITVSLPDSFTTLTGTGNYLNNILGLSVDNLYQKIRDIVTMHSK